MAGVAVLCAAASTITPALPSERTTESAFRVQQSNTNTLSRATDGFSWAEQAALPGRHLSMRLETGADHAVFLFAHQDDEYGAVPWIDRELEDGARVSCVYLTDGGSRTDPRIRDAESIAVLKRVGVAESDIHFLGGNSRIPDLQLASNIALGLSRFDEWRQTALPVTSLYTLAWEGGHPDHDAAHLIGLITALRLGIACWNFSLYHGRNCPRPFFRSLSLLDARNAKSLRYSLPQGWRWAMLCWSYRSQRSTWLGLFPGAFFRRVVMRRESVTRAMPDRALTRPHPGRLLYEWLFGLSYEEFSSRVGGTVGEIRARLAS
jgi:LmbE family N-acetylglucosaminyl deacetylase